MFEAKEPDIEPSVVELYAKMRAVHEGKPVDDHDVESLKNFRVFLRQFGVDAEQLFKKDLPETLKAFLGGFFYMEQAFAEKVLDNGIDLETVMQIKDAFIQWTEGAIEEGKLSANVKFCENCSASAKDLAEKENENSDLQESWRVAEQNLENMKKKLEEAKRVREGAQAKYLELHKQHVPSEVVLTSDSMDAVVEEAEKMSLKDRTAFFSMLNGLKILVGGTCLAISCVVALVSGRIAKPILNAARQLLGDLFKLFSNIGLPCLWMSEKIGLSQEKTRASLREFTQSTGGLSKIIPNFLQALKDSSAETSRQNEELAKQLKAPLAEVNADSKLEAMGRYTVEASGIKGAYTIAKDTFTRKKSSDTHEDKEPKESGTHGVRKPGLGGGQEKF